MFAQSGSDFSESRCGEILVGLNTTEGIEQLNRDAQFIGQKFFDHSQ